MSESQQAFVALSYNETLDVISAVTYDHNIIIYNADDMEIKKQVN